MTRKHLTPGLVAKLTDHGRPLLLARPLGTSLVLALCYLAVCALYIYLSSVFAAESSQSIEQLEQRELLKGLLFALVTSGMLLCIFYYFFHRLNRAGAEILRNQQTLIAYERRAVAGIFASSIAHDINNMLMVLTGELSEMKDDEQELSATSRERLQRLERTIADLTSLCRQLGRGGLSVVGNGKSEEFELADCIKEALAMVRRHRKVKGCEMQVDLASGIRLRASREMIQRVVINLVLNAAEAVDGRGSIGVRLDRDGDQGVLEVHDDGAGVPEEMRERVFEPFYTSKTDGTGLGLLTVKVCADTLDGSVGIERSPLGGACFRLCFPCEAAPTEAAS